MSEIDWSKAPNDATHHFARQNGYAEIWTKPGFFMRADSKSREWLKDNSPMGLECATARPLPWNGEGLPPVGVVCEALNTELSSPEWERATILYVGKHRVMYDSASCNERVGFIEDLKFRPIRTPEQIAAEERDRKARSMYELIYFASHSKWENLPDTLRETFRLAIDDGWQRVKS